VDRSQRANHQIVVVVAAAAAADDDDDDDRLNSVDDYNVCFVCLSVAIMMYVRYRQVAEYLTSKNYVHSPRVNKAALIIGLLCAFGLTLVANFQVCV